MAAVLNPNPIASAVRVLFKTIPEGDWRKFTGTSNYDPEEGGGARDLRFNGVGPFGPIASNFFPNAQQVTRQRNGVPTQVVIHAGQLRYGSLPNEVAAARFEPPTTARPKEWRLAQVAGMEPMASAKPLAGTGDEDLLVIAQQPSGEVWAVFSTVKTVQGGQFTAFIQSVATSSSRNYEHAAVGYVDTVAGTSQHNT